MNHAPSALLFCGLAACSAPSTSDQPTATAKPHEIHTPTYDLLLPAEQKALLILFPCFPCDAEVTNGSEYV
ncbi:MAG TPA: hypothetical protein PLB89_03155 [Flavobacteriales bacterium]|nr:hypothetical protein [Flavobacteriales bacterium]